MRNLNTIANIGSLFHKPTGKFLGSSFIFRGVNTLLTASHCIGDLRPEHIVISIFATGKKVYPVVEINKHPKADISVLTVQGIDEMEIGMPLHSIFDDRVYGLEVTACGYPEDSTLGHPEPTGRVFKGHIQRFVNWKSHLGYEYMAAELSFRCPGGLSGGVMIHNAYPGRTLGLITENIRTSNVLDSIEEIEKDGKIYREHYESVIYYGIALWLPDVMNWLDAVIPPLTKEELWRRSEIQADLRLKD